MKGLKILFFQFPRKLEMGKFLQSFLLSAGGESTSAVLPSSEALLDVRLYVYGRDERVGEKNQATHPILSQPSSYIPYACKITRSRLLVFRIRSSDHDISTSWDSQKSKISGTSSKSCPCGFFFTFSFGFLSCPISFTLIYTFSIFCVCTMIGINFFFLVIAFRFSRLSQKNNETRSASLGSFVDVSRLAGTGFRQLLFGRLQTIKYTSEDEILPCYGTSANYF